MVSQRDSITQKNEAKIAAEPFSSSDTTTPCCNEYLTVFHNCFCFSIHFDEGEMVFAINFCVGAVPDVLSGSKVAVSNFRDDESTKWTLLHATINQSAVSGVFEMLLMILLKF
jgi:hypothetical protein